MAPLHRIFTATLVIKAAAAWNPTCTGQFECSSLSSPDFSLWKTFDGQSVRECRYGHTEVTNNFGDEQCQRPCSGTRTAPCRCQTASEAKLKNSKHATFNLWVSVAITLFALIATCCVCQGLSGLDAKVHEEPEFLESEPQAAAGASDIESGSEVFAEHPPEPPCFAGDVDVVVTPSTSTSDHVAHVQGNANDASASASASLSESIPPLRRKLQDLTSEATGRAVGVFNKYKLVNWFFPCLLAGALAYGVHVGLAHFEEGSYYQQVSEVMKIVAVACVTSAVLLVIRAGIADTICLCFGRMMTSALVVLLVVGLVGVAWSSKQLSQISQNYYACEARHCIFGLC